MERIHMKNLQIKEAVVSLNLNLWVTLLMLSTRKHNTSDNMIEGSLLSLDPKHDWGFLVTQVKIAYSLIHTPYFIQLHNCYLIWHGAYCSKLIIPFISGQINLTEAISDTRFQHRKQEYHQEQLTLLQIKDSRGMSFVLRPPGWGPSCSSASAKSTAKIWWETVNIQVWIRSS